MAKHTQTICRQFADELFECVWPFCGIGAERIKDVEESNQIVCYPGKEEESLTKTRVLYINK